MADCAKSKFLFPGTRSQLLHAPQCQLLLQHETAIVIKWFWTHHLIKLGYDVFILDSDAFPFGNVFDGWSKKCGTHVEEKKSHLNLCRVDLEGMSDFIPNPEDGNVVDPTGVAYCSDRMGHLLHVS